MSEILPVGRRKPFVKYTDGSISTSTDDEIFADRIHWQARHAAVGFRRQILITENSDA